MIRVLLVLIGEVSVHGDANEPFVVSCMVQWFCEQVGGVFDARDVVVIDKPVVHRIANEVCADVDVFHSGVGLRVVCAGNGTLVVAV